MDFFDVFRDAIKRNTEIARGWSPRLIPRKTRERERAKERGER